MREFFKDMEPDEKLAYVVDNLHQLPAELVDEGMEILLQANEIEYAVVLARDHGLTGRAIQILVDAGDYLWAAQIARSAGLPEEAESLLTVGLDYYIGMEMFGRAVSAATALKLPASQIDALMQQGIAVESRNLDTGRARIALEEMALSLEAALVGRDDPVSREILEALRRERGEP